MARQGEAGHQYSSFLHLHFIFQALSDKQLLPEHNLNQYSFWETYLTTSDLQHKVWIYFSYLFFSRKLFKNSFHFCLFLKFWTQIEEYLLKETAFIFERSSQDLGFMSTLLCLWFLPRSLRISLNLNPVSIFQKLIPFWLQCLQKKFFFCSIGCLLGFIYGFLCAANSFN